jgi:hypothetical protein
LLEADIGRGADAADRDIVRRGRLRDAEAGLADGEGLEVDDRLLLQIGTAGGEHQIGTSCSRCARPVAVTTISPPVGEAPISPSAAAAGAAVWA